MPPQIRLLCLLLAAVAVLRPPSCRADEPAAAGLYPAAILFHKPHHTDGPQQVRRIAALGFHRLQVVVTLHCEIDAQRNVLRYGHDRRGRLVPMDDQLLAEFQEQLRRTFAAAAVERMEVAVLAHLNSTGRVYDWRNHFRFDPLAECDGWTYRQIMIDPILSAAAAELPADAVVELALCGEMGRSVCEHGQSYRQLVKHVRTQAEGPPWRLGVSFNFDGPGGDVELTEPQQAAVSALLAECDFVGMSAYRPFDLPPDAGDFAEAARQFYAAMDRHGVRGHRQLPLHFSEVGLGGGAGANRPAPTPEVAAAKPWEGVASASANPWTTPSMRDFRRQYYAALLEFLAAPPADVPIVDAFLWSELSWDPLDTIDRGFADDEIAAAIRAHNRRVIRNADE